MVVVEVQLNPMKGEEEVLLLDPLKVEEVLLNLRKEEAQLCPYDIDFDDALVVALKVVALAVEEEAEVGLHVLDPLEAEVVAVPFRQDSFHIAPVVAAAAAETVEYVAIVVDGMAAADDDDESAAVAFVVGAVCTDL